MAADLRRGEHIPKMQNNIGRESQLHVLRQLRSKDGGVLDAGIPMPAALNSMPMPSYVSLLIELITYRWEVEDLCEPAVSCQQDNAAPSFRAPVQKRRKGLHCILPLFC